MSYTGRGSISIAEWSGIIETLKETLESVLMALEYGKREGIRPDILALESLDELNSYLDGIKRDIGV